MLRGVLANVAEGGGGDPLEGQLRLLEAEHEERHSARIDDQLGELLRVPRDVAESPSCGFLHRGVELVKAAHQGLQGPGVHDGLRQLGRVLGDRSQDEGGRLLVEPVLLGQGVHQLRQDLVRHHGLRQLVAVVRQAPEGQRRGLLDGGHVVQEQRPQERHHTCVLQRIDVLRPGGQVSHGLHESDASLLVLLEHLQHCPAHRCHRNGVGLCELAGLPPGKEQCST
mmetsp:Transcript_45138/g.134930  ORF Transcript_45138/g.134930 Transcript_45138/m.134930 type:complete len:225 (+) Transcript_45138:959-1633(+)